MTNGHGAAVSGLYVWTAGALPPAGGPSPSVPPPFTREELRLDVDGPFAQMALSGASTVGFSTRVEWIARLTKSGENRWDGSIWFKHGDADRLPHSSVDVRVSASGAAGGRELSVTFRGGGLGERTTTYAFESPSFRRVELEIDTVEGAGGVTTVPTHGHPIRPGDLPIEDLSVDDVFRRAGFEVTRSAGANVLPLAAANANGTWDDAELHDAMQTYWSKFADKPQWSLWVLFAARHDAGRGLAGSMFDRIGPNQRQGLAIFTTSEVALPPASEAARDAWIARMTFFTLLHEMGHAFNLAHSWAKSTGPGWFPLQDEPASRSFMNNPRQVAGGEAAFFADFRFRFSDAELLFMRHAPAGFVEMGGASWLDDHGLRLGQSAERPDLELEVRVRPERRVFDYLEPIVLELKLTNQSARPKVIPRGVLAASERMTVILKRRGEPARRWVPFVRHCASPETEELGRKKSRYDSLFVSAGGNGWDIAEPGAYTVQVALDLGAEQVVSNLLQLNVAPPKSRFEEVLAQDYFSEDVGRVLAMDGSRFMSAANDVLEKVVDRFEESRAAHHARVALANPKMMDFKSLQSRGTSGKGMLGIRVAPAGRSRGELDAALLRNAGRAMQTLGHIDYNYYVQRYCDRLEKSGDVSGARSCSKKLLEALSKSRSSAGRPVVRSVLDAVAARARGSAREPRSSA